MAEVAYLAVLATREHEARLRPAVVLSPRGRRG
jgi:hypothetical protein